MIPKIIHYCWFSKNGKSIPPKNKKLIEGWRKILPDYEFKLWTQDNFDVNHNSWTKSAYEQGKYAFVTDYVRLYVLYNYGGVYMDTDVELIKSFDPYLAQEFILGYEGELIGTGTLGVTKNAEWVLDGLKYYENKSFIKNEEYDIELTNPVILGTIIRDQYPSFSNKIFAYDYLTAKSFDGSSGITENTIAIHHYDGSWLEPNQRIKNKITRYLWTKETFRKIYNFFYALKLILKKK